MDEVDVVYSDHAAVSVSIARKIRNCVSKKKRFG